MSRPVVHDIGNAANDAGVHACSIMKLQYS
jgi:hypothetical protein